MTLILGDYLESLPHEEKAVTISFFFNYELTNEERLDNESSFNLIVTYALNFIHQNRHENYKASMSTIRESIEYIANELLENSMKYGDRLLPKITITIHITEKKIFIISTNLIDESRSKKFKSHVQKLLDSDISDMYLRQIEDNISVSHKSGLGFLSMINDYDAQIGWKFEASEHPKKKLSSVMVQISAEPE